MKKKSLLSLLSLSLLSGFGVLSACKAEHPAGDGVMYYSQFPKDIELTGQGFIVDDELMRYPFRIRQKGEYVYLLDLHGEENFCHIFHKDDLSNVASFAQRGNGPQEMLQAMDMHVVSEDSIWVFDTNKRDVSLWSLSEQDCKVELRGTWNMKEEMVHSAKCTWSNGYCFFTDQSGKNRILKCSQEGRVMERIGDIPTEKNVDEYKKGTLAQAWSSYVNCHPGKQLLVVATQLGDVIEIYNLKKGTRRVLYGPFGEPEYKTTRKGWAVPVGIMGYSDIQITDNYIYAVFHGRSFKDIANDPQGTPDGGEYIHVYTHEGVPVCRLMLDHAVYGIDVDEKNGVIWATDVNTEEQIVKYQLPDMFKTNMP